jgi:hypothetical protein
VYRKLKRGQPFPLRRQHHYLTFIDDPFSSFPDPIGMLSQRFRSDSFESDHFVWTLAELILPCSEVFGRGRCHFSMFGRVAFI